MIPFIQNLQKKQTYRDRQQISDCLEIMVGRKMGCEQARGTFGDDGNALELDREDGYSIPQFAKYHCTYSVVLTGN